MTPSAWLHICLFVGASLCSVAVIPKLRRSFDADSERGLTALLVGSAIWGCIEAARLVATTEAVVEALYTVGLVVGLSAVLSFLYFVSAYTGAGYHRDTGTRRLAVAVFLVIVGLKLTNPLHGQYFALVPQTGSILEYGVRFGALHWSVALVAYLVTVIALYRLYRFLSAAGGSVSGPTLLVVLLPVPVALDLLALANLVPLPKLYYEPLGVAVFAVATAFVADDRLDVTPAAREHLLGQLDLPICIVGPDETITEANGAFRRLLDRDTLVGTAVTDLPSTLRSVVDGDLSTVLWSHDGERRRFRVITSPVELGPHRLGRVVILLDVTDSERRRDELERHNHELQNLVEVVTHELRNTNAIAAGYLRQLDDEAEFERPELSRAVHTATDATDRTEDIIDRFVQLLQDSRTVDSTDRIDVAARVDAIETDSETEVPISVDDDGTLVGDPLRVEHLLSNAVALASADATGLHVAVSRGVLTLTFDGIALETTDPEEVFGFGYAVPTATTGTHLPTIGLVARAHHWTASVTTRSSPDPQFTVRIDTDRGSTDAADSVPDQRFDSVSGDA